MTGLILLYSDRVRYLRVFAYDRKDDFNYKLMDLEKIIGIVEDLSSQDPLHPSPKSVYLNMLNSVKSRKGVKGEHESSSKRRIIGEEVSMIYILARTSILVKNARLYLYHLSM